MKSNFNNNTNNNTNDSISNNVTNSISNNNTFSTINNSNNDNISIIDITNNTNNTNVIHCKHCNSDHVIKVGKKGKYNKQIYYCKECKKYFSEGKDNRIKRDIKQRELALLLYSHNTSMRSIQNIINLYFNTNISIRLIEKWINTAAKLLNNDINNLKQKQKPRKIDILELDENKDRILENK